MKKLLVTFAALPLTLLAAIEPVAPQDGASLALLPKNQKKAMSGATYAERIKALKENEKLSKGPWRTAKTLTLEWKATDGDNGGHWIIELGKKPDLSDARRWYQQSDKKKSDFEFTVPMANLEAGATYYWRITSHRHCKESWICTPRHDCAESKIAKSSPIVSFRTEDAVPRWIAIEGRVKNIRDLGGWRTADGRRVRQGLIYRGQGLNDNSVGGLNTGANRLMVADLFYMTNTLGIKTDLDLRTDRETTGMTGSPLGPSVTFVHRPSQSYERIFTDAGKKAMAENFRLASDAKNLPLYFHCIAGADRTGALAYVLNGILGVSKHDLEVDWEATFYPSPNDRCHHFDDNFAKYGTAESTLQERIALYLKECGVTEGEIARFRTLMLE